MVNCGSGMCSSGWSVRVSFEYLNEDMNEERGFLGKEHSTREYVSTEACPGAFD